MFPNQDLILRSRQLTQDEWNKLDLAEIERSVSPLKAGPTWATDRKKDFLLGRLCAREALISGGVKLEKDDLTLLEDRSCKWPQGWAGSITHAVDATSRRHFVGAVVCPQIIKQSIHFGVGFDCESWARVAQSPEIKERVLLANELDRSRWKEVLPDLKERSKSEDVDALQLAIIFSVKEALFKALYPTVNRFFGFEAAMLRQVMRESGPNGGILQVQMELQENLSQDFALGTVLAAQVRIDDQYWVYSLVTSADQVVLQR